MKTIDDVTPCFARIVFVQEVSGKVAEEMTEEQKGGKPEILCRVMRDG